MTAYGDVRRRLFETLHFVKEVVLGAPGDIKAECTRVRLLHAAVRYYVQHHDNRWEVEKVSAAKEKDLSLSRSQLFKRWIVLSTR